MFNDKSVTPTRLQKPRREGNHKEISSVHAGRSMRVEPCYLYPSPWIPMAREEEVLIGAVPQEAIQPQPAAW